MTNPDRMCPQPEIGRDDERRRRDMADSCNVPGVR
jgi:hypothetical protein